MGGKKGRVRPLVARQRERLFGRLLILANRDNIAIFIVLPIEVFQFLIYLSLQFLKALIHQFQHPLLNSLHLLHFAPSPQHHYFPRLYFYKQMIAKSITNQSSLRGQMSKYDYGWDR